MKREELKNMLSQVDEQYIAEILDAEDMTSEAAPVPARPKRFAVWTAAAAVLCICTVGGGCLWWTQVHRQELPQQSAESGGEATAMQADTIREERNGYVLRWELEGRNSTPDYQRNFNGPIEQFGICELPVTVENTELSLSLYHDENGDPVEASAVLRNQEQQMVFNLSSKGKLYPLYCEGDLTEDAACDQPVIHIYDNTTQRDETEYEYELYYLHEGTAMTMRTYGFSAEEAEALAAAFLQDGTTPAKLSETATNRNEEDRTEYILVWDEGEQLYLNIDPEYLTYPASYERYTTKLIPVGGDDFTDIYGSVGFDENGIPYEVLAEYKKDGKRLTIKVNDREHPMKSPSGSLYCKELAEEHGKPTIVAMKTGTNSYQLCFTQDNTSVLLSADGYTAEEAEAITVELMQQHRTAAQIYDDEKMIDYSQYFTLEQPVPVSADFTLETNGGVHELDETSPFFDLSPFGPTDFAGRFYLRENGSTANIRLEYRSDDGRSVTVTAGGTGKMYAHGQLAEDGGTERNSGRIYGSRTEDGGTALSFRVCDWDCEIIGDGMTEEEMILFYDRLSAYLWENFGDTVFLHAEDCFSRDVSEITTQRIDLVWNGLHQYPITDPGIFTGLGLQSAEVHCTGDGTPQHALLYYSTGQTSIDIFMSSYGEMGPVFPISGASDGFRRNGIMMYGFSDAQNPDHRELCFVTANNIGVHLICYGVDAEEILALADRLIESGNSPAQLLDGN
ncbi:MAG: hypothetical protein IJY06_01480 [Oscillospiraceae bacterium]|nr:hypothetical protein [Oscillospiraceae bacterium]